MIELRPLNSEAIPAALEMAKSYRLLGEPDQAESICLDILDAEPGHQEALIILVLSLADRFSGDQMIPAFERARETVGRLDDQYCKSYYSGIIFERRARHHFGKGLPGSGAVAYEWYVKAMNAFGQALASCDPNNQDALLRWNSCARFINSHPELKPDDAAEPNMLLDAFETPH